MIVNCNLVLKALDGTSILDGNSKDRGDLTLGKALASVLVTPRQGGQIDTFRAWVLAQKFYNSETVDVDKETKQFIDSAISTYPEYNPIVTGQIREMFEEKKEEKVEEGKEEK